MLHGGSLFFTTVLSRIIVKRAVYRHNVLGCIFSISGFAIVGYAGFLSSKSSSSRFSSGDLSIGIVLNIISMVIGSTMVNVQELILRRNNIDVQRMIGLEGQFGLVWSFVFMVVVSFIPCPNSGICHRGAYLDDMVIAIREITS